MSWGSIAASCIADWELGHGDFKIKSIYYFCSQSEIPGTWCFWAASITQCLICSKYTPYYYSCNCEHPILLQIRPQGLKSGTETTKSTVSGHMRKVWVRRCSYTQLGTFSLRKEGRAAFKRIDCPFLLSLKAPISCFPTTALVRQRLARAASSTQQSQFIHKGMIILETESDSGPSQEK